MTFLQPAALWLLGLIGSALTTFYMFRLYASTFLGSYRGKTDPQHSVHESPASMTIPLIILAVLSVLMIGGRHSPAP